MEDISNYQGIEYIVLQDEEGIILASGISRINSLRSDEFLQKALHNEMIVSRFRQINGKKIYVFVKMDDIRI